MAALFTPEWMETRPLERFLFVTGTSPARMSGVVVSELINLNMHDQPPQKHYPLKEVPKGNIKIKGSAQLGFGATKDQSSYQLGWDWALCLQIPWGIAIQSLLVVMTAPSSSHAIEEHQHCLRRMRQRDLPNNLQLAADELCDSTSENVPSNS